MSRHNIGAEMPIGLPAALMASAGINVFGSLLGGMFARDSAADQMAQNTALQREFAQMGVRWRVADAKAAGVHPVFALGGSGASYSPNPVVPSDRGISEAGQALGNAVSASASACGS